MKHTLRHVKYINKISNISPSFSIFLPFSSPWNSITYKCITKLVCPFAKNNNKSIYELVPRKNESLIPHLVPGATFLPHDLATLTTFLISIAPSICLETNPQTQAPWPTSHLVRMPPTINSLFSNKKLYKIQDCKSNFYKLINKNQSI